MSKISVRHALLAAIAILLVVACKDAALPPVAPTRNVDPGFPSVSADPLPLDVAVLDGDVPRVKALLDGGAQPNARWSSHGDRFALQDAIEAAQFGGSSRNRSDIVRLLLAHGADPNARWCPFESRGTRDAHLRGCTTEEATTPLIAAAVRDQGDTVYRLLDAGADPRSEDWSGRRAIDYARSGFVFDLIAAAMFPEPATRRPALFQYLRVQAARTGDTPLSVVFTRDGPPSPASTPAAQRCAAPACHDPRAEVVQRILELGADPNERLAGGETVLTIARRYNAPQVVDVLVRHGALNPAP